MSELLRDYPVIRTRDEEDVGTHTHPVVATPSDDSHPIWLDQGIPPLEAIIDPCRFNLVVRQYGIRSKIGSILLPDSAKDAQDWLHGIGQVIKVGPSVYKGSKFADMGLSEADGFKPGDLVYFQAKTTSRFLCDGETYILIPDDAVHGRVPKAHVKRLSFKL